MSAAGELLAAMQSLGAIGAWGYTTIHGPDEAMAEVLRSLAAMEPAAVWCCDVGALGGSGPVDALSIVLVTPRGSVKLIAFGFRPAQTKPAERSYEAETRAGTLLVAMVEAERLAVVPREGWQERVLDAIDRERMGDPPGGEG